MTNLILCLFSIDHKDGSEYILSKNKIELSLPSISNDTSISIEDNLSKLVDSCIKADTKWLKLKIFELRNINDHLEVYYMGRIPYEYKYMTKDSFFISPALTDNAIVYKMKYFI